MRIESTLTIEMIMSKHCVSCQFFGLRTTESGVGSCHNPLLDYVQSEKDVPAGGLGYTDAESYKAYLYVHREFGCIHHLSAVAES